MECNTTLYTKKFTYKWTVKEWSSVTKVAQLRTKQIKLPEVENTCFFQIDLYPSGPSYHFQAHVDSFKPYNLCDVEFYAINGSKKTKMSTKHLSSSKNKSLYSCYCNIPSAENDCLTALWKISYVYNIHTVEQTCDPTVVSNHLIAMYKNQHFCDVTFLVGTEKFQAHVAVLATVSPYFSSMFTNANFIENRDRVVDLREDEDVTEKNFSGFLEYIYGCKHILELKTIVSELLVLADKFDVKQLFEACQLYMSENISQENVIKILIFSHQYNYNILKNKAIMYAKNHMEIIKMSKEFEDVCKNIDIMRCLL